MKRYCERFFSFLFESVYNTSICLLFCHLVVEACRIIVAHGSKRRQ